ncbi:hypothetical protein HDU79_002567 [Rhizoclosmatium sp. JEL0117]|nr:hypothetical protein HDU79_002567 [Rhizoclosmatium sp. JEL0117]
MSTNPFAPVASATADSSLGRRAAIVAPAMFAVVVAAHSVLVSERALMCVAAAFAWLVTVVAGPTGPQQQRLYAQLLDRWWAASLVLVLLLSLFPQTNEPMLSAQLQAAASQDALLVHLKSLSGSPWGCIQHEIKMFAVYRSNRLATKSGKFGEYAQVDIASIPHEEYFQVLPAAYPNITSVWKAPAVYKLSNVNDRDLIIKVGLKCSNFPADLLFGKELWLLDSDSNGANPLPKLHKFQSPSPIIPPKPPLVPRIVLSLLNPLQWPFLILSTLRTYTTIIELGIVWPLLTRLLRRVLINYREDRVAEGKSVLKLEADNGVIHVDTVLKGVVELLIALQSLLLNRNKKRPAEANTGSVQVAAVSSSVSQSSIDPKIKRSNSPAPIDTSSASQQQASHVRASSSPVRYSNANTPNQTKPIMKLSKSQSLWDDSSTPSRFVGNLISSVVAGGLASASGNNGKRRRRWEIPGYVFIVIKSYEPAFKDELSISIGNIIRIKKIFDDGWALGINQSTNMQGILPMAFLTCINPTSPSAPPIDPQQFIPRPAAASGVTTPVSLPLQYASNTSLTSTPANAIPEELDETILPYTDLPPTHLRKRSKSVVSMKHNITPKTTPTITPQELAPIGTTPTATTTPSTDKPRGRSSSISRGGRSLSTRPGNMSRKASTASIKQTTPSTSIPTSTTTTTTTQPQTPSLIVAQGPPVSVSQAGRGRTLSVASTRTTTTRNRSEVSTTGTVYYVAETGEATDNDDDGDNVQFEDAWGNVAGGDESTYVEEEAEVVVVDEEDSTGSNEEDRDVWPPVRPGGVKGERRGRGSLGGYGQV